MGLGRERGDDGTALEQLFAELAVSADWTIGFLSAVRSGPDTVGTSAWIPELVGAGAFTGDEAAQARVDLLTRLMGAVSETLRTTPEIVCPEPDKPEQDAVDFCSGYLRGAKMHATWLADAGATAKLEPFRVLAKEEGATAKDAAGAPAADLEAWTTAQRERLGRDVADLHAYWKGKRQVVNTSPKVGRNDPCPCGSGKKHKKCCGAA